jgi:hypothetical protein
MGIPLEDIENAVEQLPIEQLKKFREWFEKFDAKIWDKKIKHDSESGKFDELVNNALKEHLAKRNTRL